MAELKKNLLRECPFCGGEAKIDIAPTEDGYRVACKRIFGCGAKFEWFDKENEAIEAWNNRATEAEIRKKTIDDVFEFLKDNRDKKNMKVGLDDLEIRKYKEQLKERERYEYSRSY